MNATHNPIPSEEEQVRLIHEWFVDKLYRLAADELDFFEFHELLKHKCTYNRIVKLYECAQFDGEERFKSKLKNKFIDHFSKINLNCFFISGFITSGGE